MGIPGEAIGYATDYLRIIALGIPFLSVYNFYSAVIKTGEDSRALVIRPDFKYVLQIFRLGITGIVQNGASAVSMFFIQGAINQFGVNEISAYTSAYKIETILTIPAVNLGISLSVFTAQNIGAKNYERSRRGLCVRLYLLTNFLRGAGEIGYPLFNTLLEHSFRTAFAFVSVQYIGFKGIMLCRPLSLVISTISLSCRYFTKKWQQ